MHCTAASGTGPTLDASLEESADGVTWTAIPGSGITQLTAVGNRVVAAAVTKSLVRVTSTVAGTAASVTYRVALLTVLAGLAEGEEPAGGAHSLLPAETGEGFFHVQTHIALRAGAFTCPPSRVRCSTE
ncbi:hypothetical protein ACJ6WF_13575 [Streptomyces sp. MMS24-I2-30]|uniref:hypothetical protein n=1 Tax=Streptomyces sp. MMS24-I2-30 TaxID=3351564 RepID=UPI003896E6E4